MYDLEARTGRGHPERPAPRPPKKTTKKLEKLGGLRLSKPATRGYIKRCTMYETTAGAARSSGWVPNQDYDIAIANAFNADELTTADEPLSPHSDSEGSECLYNPLAFPKSDTAYDKGKPVTVALYDPKVDGPPVGRQQAKALQKTVYYGYPTKDEHRFSMPRPSPKGRSLPPATTTPNTPLSRWRPTLSRLPTKQSSSRTRAFRTKR